jgi:putative DNA primase/helicase
VIGEFGADWAATRLPGANPDQAEAPWPAPSEPMAVARVFAGQCRRDGCLTLRHWRGGWLRWQGTHWVELEDAAVRSWAYRRLEDATYLDDGDLKPWRPNRRRISDVLDALAAAIHLPQTIDPPAWLDNASPALAATEVVACGNGLLHVPTRKLLEPDCRFFTRVAVPFDYDPAAPRPERWLAFLDELWPEDPDQVAALQQFTGYLLSGRTDLHKLLLLVGPTRAGKGVIGRVLAALVGRGNTAGPTLASLGTNFGLAPLLGRPLAIISDARLAGANTHQVVERLLSVSGEDTLTVDRKYREPWTGKLPTRFVVLTNELPRFGDASGAIAARFVVLALRASWLGRENPQLTGELLSELPGILAWALDGLDGLAAQGAFTEPASTADAVIALQDLASPVAAFVRDRCTVGGDREVLVDELYTAWRTWCDDNGRSRPGSKQTFGRDLRAVVPGLRVVRSRDGETRERWYYGVALGSTCSAPDRGPSRTTDAVVRDAVRAGERQTRRSDGMARDGPRSGPLWAEPPGVEPAAATNLDSADPGRWTR